MARTQGLTQAWLKEIFDYDPLTGIFRRRATGRRAGSLYEDGYRKIKIDGSRHREHRLAWLYVHGSVPEFLDHINRVRHDNRIANLRPATYSQNRANCAPYGRSGFKGVHSNGPNWVARIKFSGEERYLGTFCSPEEAAAAYAEAAKKHFGDYACF